MIGLWNKSMENKVQTTDMSCLPSLFCVMMFPCVSFHCDTSNIAFQFFCYAKALQNKEWRSRLLSRLNFQAFLSFRLFSALFSSVVVAAVTISNLREISRGHNSRKVNKDSQFLLRKTFCDIC